ncbi:DUF1186 family protein, partial [Peptococcaceae bacterium]|nr:DUF1186 family protein [Peptococcaceae bacterium]
EDMDEYARASGVDALLILAASTIKTREEIADYYKSLFRGKLERKSSLVWCSLVLCSSYLCSREEVYEDVKKAYEEGLADPTFMSIEEVDE